MNLRAFLLAQGLSTHDIDEAVQEARQATRLVQLASGALVEVFTRAATKTRNERVKLVLLVGGRVAGKVQEGASTLLRQK